jgi:uncharacterized protein YegP (UPF0339 family)
MSKELITETGQTGQKTTKTPYMEVAKDALGKWHWVLWSGSGRQLATNAAPYKTRHDAIKAIKITVATFAAVNSIVQAEV